jgi:general secretion pathway protein J
MTAPEIQMRGNGQSGVSLVEIVVALAVIALTLALAAAGMRLLAHSGERGARLVARHDILSRGIDVLRRDIERLERAVWKRGDTTELVFHADATRLTFVAIEPPFPSQAGAYFIIYTVQRRPGGDVLTRERAPFNASTADILNLPTQDSVVLIEGPYRVRFLYLDHKDDGERWLAQWSDRYRLPSLVALEVTDLAGAAMPPIVFRPRIDAERSCVKDSGGSCTIATKGALSSETKAAQGSRN